MKVFKVLQVLRSFERFNDFRYQNPQDLKPVRESGDGNSLSDKKILIGYIKDDFETGKEVFIPVDKVRDH